MIFSNKIRYELHILPYLCLCLMFSHMFIPLLCGHIILLKLKSEHWLTENSTRDYLNIT